MTQPAVTYKFDVVAVATITITTAQGAADARAAVDSLEAIDNGWDGTLPEDAKWDLTCVAPRGRAALIDTGPGADEELAEPLTGDWRDHLGDALAEADDALGGDSNDAEHDALYSIREIIARLLGVDSDPPSPSDV